MSVVSRDVRHRGSGLGGDFGCRGDGVPGAADMAAAAAYIRDGRKGSVSVRIMRR